LFTVSVAGFLPVQLQLSDLHKNMKQIFTLALLCAAFFSKAQVSVDFGAGLNNSATPVSNIEIRYSLKKIELKTGYLVSITDNSLVHDLFFLKAGRVLKINTASQISAGTGMALHTFKSERILKAESNYSYYKTINSGSVLLYLHYQKKIMSDGAFYTQVLYSGNTFFAGAGVTYFFTKKKRADPPKK
jgi:hypothetical protein